MTEQRTVNMVIAFLGVVCLVAVLQVGLLAWLGKTIPEALNTIASASLGALGAVLASTRTKPV